MMPNSKKISSCGAFQCTTDWFQTNSWHQKRYSVDVKKICGCPSLLGRVVAINKKISVRLIVINCRYQLIASSDSWVLIPIRPEVFSGFLKFHKCLSCVHNCDDQSCLSLQCKCMNFHDGIHLYSSLSTGIL